MFQPEDFLDAYRTAVESLDVDAMLALYADDVRVFDVVETEYPDKAAFTEQISDWFASLEGEAECEIEDVAVILAPNLAVISALVEYEGNLADSGEEVEMESRVTWVLQNFDDQWRIVHEHSSIPAEEDDAFEIDDDDEGEWIMVEDGELDDDEEDEMSEEQVNDKGESDAETVDGQDVAGQREVEGDVEPKSDGEQLGDR